jgi:hypothetical protein
MDNVVVRNEGRGVSTPGGGAKTKQVSEYVNKEREKVR